MDVVWHDDKCIEEIPVVVEVAHRLLDDVPEFRPAEDASSVTLVEPAMLLCGEARVVFAVQRGRQAFDVMVIGEIVDTQPCLALDLQFAQQTCG